MVEAEFWNLIDEARAAAGGDVDAQADELLERLAGRSERDLEGFARIYKRLHVRAYRHDLWAAGTLIDGGMSDDAFSDFRDWLISRGSAAYEAVLEDPDNLVDVPGLRCGEITAESLHGVMYDAYENAVGRRLPRGLGPGIPSEPAGEPLETPQDFTRSLPRIVARVRHRYDWGNEPPPSPK